MKIYRLDFMPFQRVVIDGGVVAWLATCATLILGPGRIALTVKNLLLTRSVLGTHRKAFLSLFIVYCVCKGNLYAFWNIKCDVVTTSVDEDPDGGSVYDRN